MYRIATLVALTFTLAPNTGKSDDDFYDFRGTPQYEALTEAEREKLEAVHRDFTLLWGALDRYADDHSGEAPKSLSDLTPRYLRELPADPFATKATAEETDFPYYKPSNNGYGYRYRQGVKRSWVISSVGLADFPYLSSKGNISLYIAKGRWISGRQPTGHEITNGG